MRYTSYVKLNISTLSHALCVGFMICDSVDPIHSAALGIGIYLCKLVVKSQNHSGFAGKSFRTMYDIYLAFRILGKISTDYINSTGFQGQCCTTTGAWHY